MGTKLSWSVVHLELANHSVPYIWPPTSLLMAHGLYMNFIPSVGHPFPSIISHPTAARVSIAIIGKSSHLTQTMLTLSTLWMAACRGFLLLLAGAMPF